MTSWARSSGSSAGLAAALALCLASGSVHANGRMPGATALTLGAGDTERLVVRATYGIVTSRDGGKKWNWVCEQAVGVSGEADPPLAVTGDGTLILVAPRGGLLTSKDEGCTWSPGPALFEGKKTVDLAGDPADPARVVVLASTVDTIDDHGLVSYANLVGETRNGGESFEAFAALPSDFVGETLEVAPSDAKRVYVSGTANDDPLVGVVLRTKDGGATWSRFTLPLPQGSGSVFISAIDPKNPDRLWIRVPGRGDTFGFFPAALLVSEDGGEHFTEVARTTRAMFGFALSPDGAELAYGGPFDGLYVGPSDGSAFTKVSSLGVRCLKWRSSGLYACASQPGDAFTLGLSPLADGAFESLYDARTTCPEACPAGGNFARACESTWNVVGPGIGAPASCPLPWSAPDAGVSRADASVGGSTGVAPDAGFTGANGGTAAATGGSGGVPSTSGGSGPVVDASVQDAGDVHEVHRSSSDCACGIPVHRRVRWTELAVVLAATFGALRRRQLQSPGSSRQR
jgi:photosystem II stability/assembly factor-like uncharacterized protein